MSQEQERLTVPQCTSCGDVIGVYEPAVVVVDGVPRDTSLAAEPSALPRAGAWHHRACFREVARALAYA